MRHWIFSCKKITAMVSESMDRNLPLSRRMGIRFHLMMCSLCRRYQQQMLFIRAVVHRNKKADDKAGQTLPDDARERIEKKLIDEMPKD